MLNAMKIMTFVPTRNPEAARSFYEKTLGLRFLSDDKFALIFDANGIILRLSRVPEFKPDPFTILGWEVLDIQTAVAELQTKGVQFEKYGFPGQDEHGIWTAPGGTRVAWFKDPDGNVLSLTQFV
ncbi:MAG TPA: VOC family protein [Terriglobales bacterium]|nr:VOC family protein [Terriglobales bacterium]